MARDTELLAAQAAKLLVECLAAPDRAEDRAWFVHWFQRRQLPDYAESLLAFDGDATPRHRRPLP
ncbi:hypothetical protein GCM10020295_49780 [Streptomyces cinereospinus]